MSVSFSRNGRVAIVTIDHPPVNATSHAVRQGLLDALTTAETDTTIKCVVLHCAGRTFIAGADIREFAQPPKTPHLPDVILAIESADKPWIAALHGSVLGGGLEVAMGCHYRIAQESTRLGLPEVTLGLIPGAGGTVRLPRLVDASVALDMIATGKPIPAQRARDTGLIDELVADNPLNRAMEVAESLSFDRRITLKQRVIEPADTSTLSARIENITSRARGQHSMLSAITAVQNTLSMTAEAALEKERSLFLQLKNDPQSHALRHVFFAERSVGKLVQLEGSSARPVERIGVVGGGTMGAGIAAACLLAGCTLTLIEQDAQARDNGLHRIEQILDDSEKRRVIDAAQRVTLQSRLNAETEYAALRESDLVIEAVYEDMTIKQAVFAALDQHTHEHCVLASNTSYLDINALAATTRHPERVLGLHFFSPAHVMKLLEIVVTKAVAADVLATGFALGKRLRKICVPAGVCDGFIGNRMMSAYRRECEFMLEQGALPQDVDSAMRDYGFAMGLFEMQDLAGLDIAWAMRKRQAADRDTSMPYVDIPDKLCESGRLGRKSGSGWYQYTNGKAEVDSAVTRLILDESERKGITRQSLASASIMQRILSALQTTGKQILEEGIAQSADDIDVVMINGYGFPRYRGGPLYASRLKTI